MMTRVLSLLVHGQCCLQLFLAISSSENGSAIALTCASGRFIQGSELPS